MSVREFARHLGFNDAAVSNWEARADKARLRHNTQQVLDVDLSRAPVDVQDRFARAISQLTLKAGLLGSSSSTRTAALLDSLNRQAPHGLIYRPPLDAADNVRAFVRSRSQVYLLAGPAGGGKTSLTRYLAVYLPPDADMQLLSVESWNLATLDLPAEILRYGSVAAGDDSLLTLENEAQKLSRPCVTVIDGINTQAEFHEICRRVDGILRQVTSANFRFLLVVRTPPGVETAGYPVLDANVFGESRSQNELSSYAIKHWEHAEARSAWDDTKMADQPSFEDLPMTVQRLARLPLHLRLLLTTGNWNEAAGASAYALIDQCVRTTLAGSSDDVEAVVSRLSRIASRQLPELMRDGLLSESPQRDNGSSLTASIGTPAAAILRVGPSGDVVFAHDVLREYFVATRIAELIRARGQSMTTVGALNSLAVRASTSATALTVFELVVDCLDGTASDLLSAVAQSPTISVEATLPMMLGVSGGNLRFVTAQVIRAAAQRCDRESTQGLARSLLSTHGLDAALGKDYASWILRLIRRRGQVIWGDVVEHFDKSLDTTLLEEIRNAADLAGGSEAIFFARHFFMFLGDKAEAKRTLDALLTHHDWRVRAALAEGLRDSRANLASNAELLMESLVVDGDYKVRATAAMSISSVQPDSIERFLEILLHDDNWHVRESILQGVLLNGEGSLAVDLIVDRTLSIISTDATWEKCPAHILPTLMRLQLLAGRPCVNDDSEGWQRAMFGILREMQTGWSRVPADDRSRIVAYAEASGSWLVRNEAEALLVKTDRQPRKVTVFQREEFRRLRGSRTLQVALDMHDLDEAIRVGLAASLAGVDFLEIGDLLLKRVGLRAIEQVKRHVPHVTVVAEMMSTDWGRDQVVLAAEAGADVVLLIGPATTASVAAAVRAGRRLGVPILLDAPIPLASQSWVSEMERAGVDGFTITTNIDVGIGSRDALASARALRQWTQLPAAVSGGFSPADHSIISGSDWDILIVGRSISDAVDPVYSASLMVDLVHGNSKVTR